MREGSTRYRTASLSEADQVVEAVAPLLRDEPREVLLCVLLDTKNRITGIVTLTTGTLHSSLVNPSLIFRPAILANCERVILVHNHPSGDPAPSLQDTQITRQAKEAGAALQIRLLDHIVIGFDDDGRPSYFSHSEKGLI